MGFDFDRLRLGDRIIAGGAIALLISMFVFDWFGVSISGTIPGSKASVASTGYNGWETFTNSRWVWLLTVIVALGYVATIAAARELPEAIQASSLVTLLGGVSSLLILYRMHPPPDRQCRLRRPSRLRWDQVRHLAGPDLGGDDRRRGLPADASAASPRRVHARRHCRSFQRSGCTRRRTGTDDAVARRGAAAAPRARVRLIVVASGGQRLAIESPS